ncbi:thioredoxin [Desulfosudis oleivorans]|uniref:Thioredoxin n=1 Tax=Desulfosudis oleivorans (strain DSM 6200 / JCM 39069 / Hxd3) TaxID=96561 RepID=A8ZZK1_DESOH|nr:thioredoxin [Desulfosudis oleivorans]ABW68873.1 thioredoxin [Desulfosudis oleivorans Hxd3]
MATIKIANRHQFQEAIQQGVALIDFNAAWCAPCRAQAPIIEKIAAELQGKALVAEANVDDNIDSAKEYGIQSIPTLILFKDGKEIQRFVGLQPEALLTQTILQTL